MEIDRKKRKNIPGNEATFYGIAVIGHNKHKVKCWHLGHLNAAQGSIALAQAQSCTPETPSIVVSQVTPCGEHATSRKRAKSSSLAWRMKSWAPGR